MGHVLVGINPHECLQPIVALGDASRQGWVERP